MKQAQEDSDSGIEDEEAERAEIRKDRTKIKELLKIIKNRGMSMTTTKKEGLQVLYDMFDKDNSDELELNEFTLMATHLKLGLNKRIGIMLFRLFDRRDIGCFSYEEFSDIVYRRLKPNYRRIIRMERNRWKMGGADPTWPARPKNGPIKVKVP